MSTQPIRICIAGLGRSGFNIHFKTLQTMRDRFAIAAVFDPSAERRTEAAAAANGCRAYETLDELLADNNVEAVVVASPNHFHTEHSIAAMRRGKHVVCEKPFSLNTADADRMIDAATQTGMTLAPFHNRRYEPHLLKVKEVLDSGVLGQIVQIRCTWHVFSRRWDWQTLKEFGGGSLNNNGSHLLDQALHILGDGVEPQVFADIKRTSLTSGDAEDHLKVLLTAQGRPTIDVELTNAAAYQQDRWHVMATSGGLRGTPEELEWKWVDFSKMPPRPVDRSPATGRAYNKEELTWQRATWTEPKDSPPTPVLFYHDLFETIRHGRPLTITPQSVRRLIWVTEQCRRQSSM